MLLSFRKITSIASAHSSLPENKGDVSCMNTSKRLTVSLVGSALPEHANMSVFTDDLRAPPTRTQLFRVPASTTEKLCRQFSRGVQHKKTPITA